MEDVCHRGEERARCLMKNSGECLGECGVVGVKEEGEIREN